MFNLRLILVFSFLIILTSLSLAQVDTAWVRLYDGPGNNHDHPHAIAVDTGGNVYVTGESYNSGGFPLVDYATIKYGPNGDTLWVRRYNGPADSSEIANAIAVDNTGNVYVTGESQGSGTTYDYATIKYKPNGDTLWVRRYNGPGNATENANALAVDNGGNVYVTGNSDGTNGRPDYLTIKYASNGDTLWVRRFNGPGNDNDFAYDLAVDNSSNVYVTGGVYNGGGHGPDNTTIKYKPNGDTAWVKNYNGPGNADDYGYALAVDNGGNVYVTGSSIGSGLNYDYATIKYSPPCLAKPGDANASGTYSLSDVIAIVNYIFNKPGCSPQPLCWISSLLCRGDWDGGGTVSLSDVIRAVNYIFNKPGGPWNALPVGMCCL